MEPLGPSRVGFKEVFALPKIFWESEEISVGNLPVSVPPLPMLLSRSDQPSLSHWHTLVNLALKEIASGNLQKVVIARKTTFSFASSINPWTIFTRLRKNSAKTSIKFCVEYEPHQAFLGATPEILFSRQGNVLKTMALAGTQMKKEAFSSKEQKEVDCVVTGIHNALQPLAKKIDIGPLSIVQSANVYHLHYPIEALLHENITDTKLIQALSPTPATCGWPVPQAQAFLKTHEPWTRGPFAEPLGFSEKEKSLFVVGIRSGRVEGCRLHLFAGAGIVANSNPDLEWLELEAKISPFLETIH